VKVSDLEEPKHAKPFHMALTFECADFPEADSAPRDQGTTCKVVVRLFGDKAPYAADNFRRLCEKPTSEGGYLGSPLTDVTPGLGVSGGLINEKNVSSFDGKPFTNEDEEDTDHGKWTLSMVSSTKLKTAGRSLPEGCFGSEFLIYSGDDGDTAAAMMDDDESFYAIGKIVEGTEMVRMLDDLTLGKKWSKVRFLNMNKDHSDTDGEVANVTADNGACDTACGAPGVPVTLSAAEELKNYLAPTSKKHKHGRRRRGQRRRSNDREHRGSITKREDDTPKFASVIDMGPDSDDMESKEGNASVIESCAF
jgi:cyclophilin family peptidyl-prolyl cis-trans isomerase